MNKRRNITNLIILLALAMVLSGCKGVEDKSKTHEGMAYIEAMDYDSALDSFAQAKEKKENAELIARGEGIAYMGKMDYAQAVSSFEESLGYCYGNVGDLEVDTNYYLAAAYYRNDELPKAIAAYTSIIDYRPKESDAYYKRGTVELEYNQYDSAVVDFDKAISLKPDDYGKLIDIYISLDANGYTEAGQQYLIKAMNEGQDKMSDFDMGRLKFYNGDFNEARTYLEKARDKNKDKNSRDASQIIIFLGRTYEALGDFNYAASVYEDYTASHEPSQDMYNQLAMCKIKVNDYETALNAVKSGLELEGSPATLKALKANEIICYEHLGDFTKAKHLMEDYSKKYPEDTDAKREAEFLSTR